MPSEKESSDMRKMHRFRFILNMLIFSFGHLFSIKTFISIQWFFYGQQRTWSNCMDAVYLGLCCMHMPEDMFLHGAAHIYAKYLNRLAAANSLDSDQTDPKWTVWWGSVLFAILPTHFMETIRLKFVQPRYKCLCSCSKQGNNFNTSGIFVFV